jgi:excisionase family DNA binding protein
MAMLQAILEVARIAMITLKIEDEALKNLVEDEVKKIIETMDFEPIMIDTNELCRLLSLSRPTVEKLFIYNEAFPSVRIGKKWLFKRNEVEAYINKWFKENKGGVVDIE